MEGQLTWPVGIFLSEPSTSHMSVTISWGKMVVKTGLTLYSIIRQASIDLI